MSTELSTTPVEILAPISGDILTLDSPSEDLGRLLAEVREYESLLREAKSAVSQEILRRQDREGKWTTHLPGMKLVGKSPAPAVEYDGPMLHEALMMLVDEDVISVEAAERAVEPVTTYEPRLAGIKALRKLGGRVEAVVAAHATEVSPKRYVRVERAI